ncbi:uncharacterized protein JCM6883_004110 [Sporobolomyces salmoneus]|uniref:uncharacterized protein n=1 Tax=Sporobolomyces salmoneus TaxID=183962 RepID=UPI0031700BBC
MPPYNSHTAQSSNNDQDDEPHPEVGEQATTDDIERPKGLINFGEAPFGGLVGLFDVLESSQREGHKKPGYKGNLIAKFFARWREVVGPDLYPLIRLLLPERDTRRRTYNLKEQKLAKAIVTALDLPPESADARKLINWKVPTKEDEAAGEFATVAEKVILSRSSVISKYGSLSVDGVNEILDEISRTVPTTGPDGKKKMPSQQHAHIIKGCISSMTPKEMKWFIRIILRDLKAGVREKTIFKQFHEDAVDVFNTCSDIKRVCWQLWDPNSRVSRDNSTIVPFRSFVPMFCYRLKGGLGDIVTMMKRGRPNVDPSIPLEAGAYNNNEFIVEEKLDGERIQLHKVGDQYRYFSRKAKEYTYLYGADITAGSLTPVIANLLDEDFEDLILDGEMLVWDPNLVKYMPFGNLKTFAIPGHREMGPNDPRPCFKVFDVLYARRKGKEGTSCLEMPLWKRKHLLSTLFTPKKGVMELADAVRAESKEDIKTYLERIVAERGEGLVIKHPLSKYLLGSRDPAWIKVKPEYMDALGETIDAVVIGGYWGEGRRGGVLSSFLVGLRDEQPDGTARFLSFAKVGSGLNRDDYKWIGETIGSKLQPIKKGNPLPTWFSTRGEMPDVLVNPADSFVLEIKAAEIVGGAEYGADMTLRFPRAMKIRHDRSYLDSNDLNTVKEMRSVTKKRDLIGEEFTKRKKARVAPRTTKATAVAPQLAQVEVTTDIFAGLTIYVNDKKKDMSQITNKVREHGARIVQGVPAKSGSNGIIISKELDSMLLSKKQIKEVDVVSPSWVLESVEHGRRLPLHKRFVLQATPATQANPAYENDVGPLVKEDEAMVKSDEEMEAEEEDQDQVEDVEFDGPIASSISSTFGTPRVPLLQDSDEDGQEPDTEEPDTEEDDDDDKLSNVAGPASQESNIAALMNRSRLATRSPTREPDLWTGIFSPYTVYFDTEINAKKNQLMSSSNSTDQPEVDKSLLAAQAEFVKFGGNATQDLADVHLTHIVMNPSALGHRLELHNRTKEPKLRRIITQDWIKDSIEMGSVLDETRYIA